MEAGKVEGVAAEADEKNDLEEKLKNETVAWVREFKSLSAQMPQEPPKAVGRRSKRMLADVGLGGCFRVGFLFFMFFFLKKFFVVVSSFLLYLFPIPSEQKRQTIPGPGLTETPKTMSQNSSVVPGLSPLIKIQFLAIS